MTLSFMPSEIKISSLFQAEFSKNLFTFISFCDRKDRMSMYSGLEVRVPFCDYRIAEYMYNVQWQYKDWKGHEKGLLREAMKNYLPEEVLWRKKSPYPKTHNPVYMEIVSKKVQEILQDKNSALSTLLNRDGIKDIMDNPDKIETPWYGQLMRAPQIMAYIIELDEWFKTYNVEIDI